MLQLTYIGKNITKQEGRLISSRGPLLNQLFYIMSITSNTLIMINVFFNYVQCRPRQNRNSFTYVDLRNISTCT